MCIFPFVTAVIRSRGTHLDPEFQLLETVLVLDARTCNAL